MDINQIKKDSSIGRVVGDYEISLFDDNGIPINKINVAGRLGLKSKAMMGGYFDTRANVPSLIDGYFLTGDIAYMDEEGFIFLKGRDKDMIIVGGEKVYPAELWLRIVVVLRKLLLKGIWILNWSFLKFPPEYLLFGIFLKLRWVRLIGKCLLIKVSVLANARAG